MAMGKLSEYLREMNFSTIVENDEKNKTKLLSLRSKFVEIEQESMALGADFLNLLEDIEGLPESVYNEMEKILDKHDDAQKNVADKMKEIAYNL